MKHMLLALGLSMAVVGVKAHAEDVKVSCENGSIEQVGDAYFRLDILENGLAFSPYEGSFTVPYEFMVATENTIAILDAKVVGSAEGEAAKFVLDAVLNFNTEESKVNLALSYNKGPFVSYELTCYSTQDQ